MTTQKQTVRQHLTELRQRLLLIVFFLVLGTIVGFTQIEWLQHILIQPLGEKIYYTSPAGGLTFNFTIALLFGCIISFPVTIYQLLSFLQPAANKMTIAHVYKATFAAVALAILGVLFAYYFSLPAALQFLQDFSNDSLQALITAQDYLSFVLFYIFGSMLVFQTPLFVYLAYKLASISAKTLLVYSKFVILISFVAAAIITPTTDPLNLIIMAMPTIVLYLVSVAAVWLVEKNN